MTLFVLFVDYMSGCVSNPATRSFAALPLPSPKTPANIIEPEQKISFDVTALTVSLRHGDSQSLVNADFYRPHPSGFLKTLVIIVPGSGNISRQGEVSSDGIRAYRHTLNQSQEWAKALANQGFFVLTYDKRTCRSTHNPTCHDNDQRDIDQEGIEALAKDLDQVYKFGLQLVHFAGIFLLGSTQGAQVITLAHCKDAASGIILLSPILGDLESMWVSGLTRASGKAHGGNQLLNRKESMISFFTSLKRGDFPLHAAIRGASVNFWQSWLFASQKTLPALISLKKPTLLLLSLKDDFRETNLIDGLQKKASAVGHIKIRDYGDNDRNFVHDNGVPPKPLSDLVTFIKNSAP